MSWFTKLWEKWRGDKPFPDSWLTYIEQNVPYYKRLSPDKQQGLQDRTQKLIRQKHFEGCGGLSLTDEIIVTIAAQACILVLGYEHELFSDLRAVLVYPRNYFANVKQASGGGVITEGVQQRLGESSSHGNVVLAWDDTLAGASDEQDGRNLVFHEFAHQLDRTFGISSRVKLAPSGQDDDFTIVLRNSYQSFISDLEMGISTLIDPYGAKNPAEFFAVATEAFFEQPLALRQKYPKLYEQLGLFYRQNPVEYF